MPYDSARSRSIARLSTSTVMWSESAATSRTSCSFCRHRSAAASSCENTTSFTGPAMRSNSLRTAVWSRSVRMGMGVIILLESAARGRTMKPFVVNRYGRIVFPFNFFPELDFSIFETLEQFAAVIKRDFEEKAPTEADIAARVEARTYAGRYDLLRDLALDLFWVNRYAMTMYDKRPTRWRDVPKTRDDVFLPVFKPWEGRELAATIEDGYRARAPSCRRSSRRSASYWPSRPASPITSSPTTPTIRATAGTTSSSSRTG